VYTRIALIVLVCAALVSCGGGHAPTDQLFTLNADNRWVYRFTGSVTLPASRGGGTETVRADQSTLTFQVLRETAKDAQGADVGLLDRTFHLVLLDGRSVDGVLRLYFSQTAQGIYVHGVQTFVGEPAGSPTWVPLTAAPPYQFLYLPNPAGDGSALGYGQPFGTAFTGG
jgi:hypothetical protein